MALVVAMVAVLAVVLAVALSGDRPKGAPPQAGTSTAAGPSPTPGGTGTSSAVAPAPGQPGAAQPSPVQPSPTVAQAPALPAGWHLHEDQTGFKVPVPGNWTITKVKTETYFREPGANGGRVLIIDQTDRPNGDPVQDWTNKERERNYRDYQRIGINPVQMGQQAADWEYLYTSKDGNRLHVRKRGVVFREDQAYGISWVVGADDWDESLDDLDIIVKGFVPAAD